MKKLAILSAAFILVALVGVVSLVQAKSDDKSPLLAEWSVSFSAQGQEIPGTFKLEKDGDNYKGLVTTDLSGEAPLRNIKIKDDNTFTAEITVNAQGQAFDGTMTGKLEGETLSGELNLSGLGAVPYSGKKVQK